MAFPHRVDIHRRLPAGVTEAREQRMAWSRIAQDIPCDLQPGGGAVEQEGHGRRAEGGSTVYFEGRPDVREDDGLRVTRGPGPERRLVTAVNDWGDPHGIDAELSSTDEDFGEDD